MLPDKKIERIVQTKLEFSESLSEIRYIVQKSKIKQPTRCKQRDLGRIIAAQILGRTLKWNEVVHHIDGNHYNHKNNNLLVCTLSYHAWLHNKIRKTETFQKYFRKVCLFFHNGLSSRQISKELKVGRNIIIRIMNEYGLHREKTEAEKLKWKTQNIKKPLKHTKRELLFIGKNLSRRGIGIKNNIDFTQKTGIYYRVIYQRFGSFLTYKNLCSLKGGDAK